MLRSLLSKTPEEGYLLLHIWSLAIRGKEGCQKTSAYPRKSKEFAGVRKKEDEEKGEEREGGGEDDNIVVV